MHPYLPFTTLPIAVAAALFAASQWPGSDPGRYQVRSVTRIEEPSVPANMHSRAVAKPEIRVAAFLPHLPPRPPSPTPALILHSVMTGTDVHLATINGRVVGEGDSIAGYQVQRIAADGVELAKEGVTRRLPMRPLHELPPPVQPGTDPVQRKAAVRGDSAELTRNFWATFDSSQPEI